MAGQRWRQNGRVSARVTGMAAASTVSVRRKICNGKNRRVLLTVASGEEKTLRIAARSRLGFGASFTYPRPALHLPASAPATCAKTRDRRHFSVDNMVNIRMTCKRRRRRHFCCCGMFGVRARIAPRVPNVLLIEPGAER